MDAKDLFILVPLNSHGTYSDNSSICQAKTEAFSKLPVSAGPYKVAEFVIGDHILLERFDDWFGWGQKIIGSDGKRRFSTFKISCNAAPLEEVMMPAQRGISGSGFLCC